MNKPEVLEKTHRDWLVLILRADSVRRAIDAFEALIVGGERRPGEHAGVL